MLDGISLGIMTVIVLLLLGFILTLFINAFLIPLLKTPKEVIGEIVDIMDLKKEDHLVDLGSGDGRLLLKAHSSSGCKCTGYDISPMMLIIAQTKKILQFPLSKDFTFEVEDIFKADLKEFTKVYCYLDEKSLEILKPKLLEFVKSGGEVYSYKYNINNINKKEKIILKDGNPLYIYGKL
jgi:predicted TPR repeat methyltransferase